MIPNNLNYLFKVPIFKYSHIEGQGSNTGILRRATTQYITLCIISVSVCNSGYVSFIHSESLNYAHFFAPHGLQPTTKLLYPWNSPGKNTGAGRHSLLQGTFLAQGSDRPRSPAWQTDSLPSEPLGKLLLSLVILIFVFLIIKELDTFSNANHLCKFLSR